MPLWLRFALICVAVQGVSLSLLRPSGAEVAWLAGLQVVSLGATDLGMRRWGTRTPWARLWPLLPSLAMFAMTGIVTDGLAPTFSGFYIVAFVHVGLTQRPGTATKLVPVAAACWLVTNEPVDSTVLARLPVAVGVWLLVGELLSRVTAERRTARAQLAQQASVDALTALYNRHGLDDRVAALEPGDAVVLVDLDHFKAVNDTFGHETGDRVLRDLGRVILAVLRPRDQAIRYGGEEMLLLLPRTDRAGVDACIDRLRLGWSASHPELTFSAGTAMVDGEGGWNAIQRADRALYQAKNSGRARMVHDDDITAPPTRTPRPKRVPAARAHLNGQKAAQRTP
jgi:diguanylate cyclase (GGDEF)-like protein